MYGGNTRPAYIRFVDDLLKEEDDKERQSSKPERVRVVIREPPKTKSTGPGRNQEVHHQEKQQSEQSSEQEDMMACLDELDSAFNACLRLAENKVPVPVDGASSSHSQESTTQVEAAPVTELDQGNSDFPARAYQDFVEAAHKLRRYFINQLLPSQLLPTKAEILTEEIAAMEEEVRVQDELIQKAERQVLKWRRG